MCRKTQTDQKRRTESEITQVLSIEQITFADIVADALVEAWVRDCRKRAKRATTDSSQRAVPNSTGQ